MDCLVIKIKKYFKEEFAVILDNLDAKFISEVEEIRIRANKPVVLHTANDAYFIDYSSRLCRQAKDAYIFRFDDVENLISAFCNHSIYAFDKDIKNGFITIEGGIRVGISGQGVFNQKQLFSIRNFTGLNIRIPRQIIGISKKVLPYIYTQDKFLSTFIISPPNCGKTTLIRDICRAVSDGDYSTRKKTLVVDERSEIAGVGMDLIYDVGVFTDVIDRIDKNTAIFMALRSLSPQVIVVDEVGDRKDLDSIYEIVNCGVKIIATAHADSIESLKTRVFFRNILEERVIDRFIFLNCELGRGTVKYILDKNLNSITSKPFLLEV